MRGYSGSGNARLAPMLLRIARSNRSPKSSEVMTAVAESFGCRYCAAYRRLHPPVHRLSVIAIDRHEKLNRLDVRRDLKALTIRYWLVFHLRKVGHWGFFC
jgi:hypothetical protein